jgi:hypothetical protein
MSLDDVDASSFEPHSIDSHLEAALEHSTNDTALFHIRQALQLYVSQHTEPAVNSDTDNREAI